MKIFYVSAISIVLGAACSPAPAEAPASANSEAAIVEQIDPPVATGVANTRAEPVFERTDPSSATMSYDREGDIVTLTIIAGGIPNGAASAADCAIKLRGLQGGDDVVRGEVVPWSSDTTEVTSADIGPNALKVDVMIGPEGAMVTDHGAASKLCGMGSQLDGFYKRLDTPD